jgi:hypothetical protein
MRGGLYEPLEVRGLMRAVHGLVGWPTSHYRVLHRGAYGTHSHWPGQPSTGPPLVELLRPSAVSLYHFVVTCLQLYAFDDTSLD